VDAAGAMVVSVGSQRLRLCFPPAPTFESTSPNIIVNNKMSM
jgi:hypothetical protein